MVSPTYVAKAALFNKKNQILLLTRSSTDDRRAGDFDFPGGSVDKGESLTDAVLREIKEETGLVVPETAIKLAYTETHFQYGENLIRFLFVGDVRGDPVVQLSHEHDTYRWLPLAEAFSKYSHSVWMGGLKYLKDNELI